MINRISEEEARVVLEGSLAKRTAVRVIAQQVALDTGIPINQILSRERRHVVARARHLVMYRAHKAGHSLSHIGRCLDRDHTSVIHGIRRIRKILGQGE